MDNKNNTRFCEKCGNQIKNGDRFCEHCGAEIKPLPMTSVNEKPTDIKSDKKSKEKISCHNFCCIGSCDCVGCMCNCFIAENLRQ